MIVRSQYSTDRICSAIGDITTIQFALYCKVSAKCSAHPPVYAMWNVAPSISKVLIAPHIYASIFSCRHLRRYCRYHDSSMRVIVQTVRIIQCISYRLRYVNCGPGYIQSIYSSWYSGHYIQLIVSALQLEISRQFNSRYTAKLVPNAAHIHQFTLCEMWHRPYPKYL
jgi:hypothetical protein